MEMIRGMKTKLAEAISHESTLKINRKLFNEIWIKFGDGYAFDYQLRFNDVKAIKASNPLLSWRFSKGK